MDYNKHGEVVTTDLLLIGGHIRETVYPPIWRTPEFRRNVNETIRGLRHFRRARANLWSGERKRQVADGQ